MFDSLVAKIKEQTAKLPSVKTAGIVTGVAVAATAYVAISAVATAAMSDLGHEIIDLF